MPVKVTPEQRVVLRAVHPNAGVTAWYQRQLEDLLAEAHLDAALELTLAYRDRPKGVGIAADQALHAAGVMYVSCVDENYQPFRRVLLCERADGAGWAFPGGEIESGETSEEAARREVREEIGRTVEGSLRIVDTRMGFATYEHTIDFRFQPVLNAEHVAYAWVTPTEALTSYRLHPGVHQTLMTLTSGIALDAQAKSIKRIDDVLRRWGKKWNTRFERMASKIADGFARKAFRMTDVAMKDALKQGGFTVAFKATRKSIQAFKLVLADNVGLIRNLQASFYNQIQQDVWASVRAGSDLHTLSGRLQDSYGITKKRAALISRDQNAKAKAVIETTRRQELGITRAIWQHSAAGKEPRPVHAAWGREQKVFELSKGLYDPDEGEYVFPGQLINCRCTSRAIIEGFDDE